MTTEELQKILQTEGYIAHVDDDGDLTFKAQGRTLYMTLSEDDPTYLRIFTDLTVPADKADELAVLREGNRLECKLKCVKCMLLDQDEERYFIRVAIECFSDTEILEEEITRYIDIVCADRAFGTGLPSSCHPLPVRGLAGRRPAASGLYDGKGTTFDRTGEAPLFRPASPGHQKRRTAAS